MPKNNRYRLINTIPFANNSRQSMDLPRDLLYHHLGIRLKGEVDIVTAVTTAWADAPWSLIRRIEIVADGKDTIKSIEGEFLRNFNRIFYGTDPAASAMPTAVAANQPFNAFMHLPFEMPRSVRPIDTLLDSRRLSTFQMVVTWGDSNSVYSANPANATITPADTTLEVSAMQSFGLDGPFAAHKQLNISKDVTQVDPNFQIILPVGNLFRAFLVTARNYGVAPANVEPGTGSNVVIQKLTLRSGTEVFFNKNSFETQDDNKRLYGIENWPAGWYVIEFAPDGLLTESLNTSGFSSLDLLLDVLNPATTNRIKVYPIEVIAPPAPARK